MSTLMNLLGATLLALAAGSAGVLSAQALAPAPIPPASACALTPEGTVVVRARIEIERGGKVEVIECVRELRGDVLVRESGDHALAVRALLQPSAAVRPAQAEAPSVWPGQTMIAVLRGRQIAMVPVPRTIERGQTYDIEIGTSAGMGLAAPIRVAPRAAEPAREARASSALALPLPDGTWLAVPSTTETYRGRWLFPDATAAPQTAIAAAIAPAPRPTQVEEVPVQVMEMDEPETDLRSELKALRQRLERLERALQRTEGTPGP